MEEETKRRKGRGAKSEDGKCGRGVTAKGRVEDRKGDNWNPSFFAHLPSLSLNPQLRASPPSLSARGDPDPHPPTDFRCCPPRPSGCKLGSLVNSLYNFPPVSRGAACFPGPFLSLQPSGISLPADPSQAPATPLSTIPPALWRGSRLPDALRSLSEPSIKGGRLRET